MRARLATAATLLLSGGCFFEFDRGFDLEPGDVGGRALRACRLVTRVFQSPLEVPLALLAAREPLARTLEIFPQPRDFLLTQRQQRARLLERFGVAVRRRFGAP